MSTFQKFAARDATIILLAAMVWWLGAGVSAGTGPLSDLSGVVAGLLVGVSGFVLHEWGHLLAGFAAGATAYPNSNLVSASLFTFDSRRSTLAQFLIMSIGGFLVTGLFLLLVYWVLPDGLLATRVARGSILFLASLTVLLEFPLVAIGVLQGRAPAQAGM